MRATNYSTILKRPKNIQYFFIDFFSVFFIEAVLCALSKDLLLLQSLVYVLIYQENKAIIAEKGQIFSLLRGYMPSHDIVEMIIVYDCFSK